MDFIKIQTELVFSAHRSRGPGGQHVNKTNSSAQLKWDYQNSNAIESYQKHLIAEKLLSYTNKSGELVLRSDSYRDLESNKKDVLKKLHSLLQRAFKKEKPRIATKPTYGSKQRRHSEKKMRGDLKKSRNTKWS